MNRVYRFICRINIEFGILSKLFLLSKLITVSLVIMVASITPILIFGESVVTVSVSFFLAFIQMGIAESIVSHLSVIKNIWRDTK